MTALALRWPLFCPCCATCTSRGIQAVWCPRSPNNHSRRRSGGGIPSFLNAGVEFLHNRQLFQGDMCSFGEVVREQRCRGYETQDSWHAEKNRRRNFNPTSRFVSIAGRSSPCVTQASWRTGRKSSQRWRFLKNRNPAENRTQKRRPLAAFFSGSFRSSPANEAYFASAASCFQGANASCSRPFFVKA